MSTAQHDLQQLIADLQAFHARATILCPPIAIGITTMLGAVQFGQEEEWVETCLNFADQASVRLHAEAKKRDKKNM